VEAAVPRKIVNASGGFEEDNRRARGLQLLASDFLCHRRNIEIVEAADNAAFDALCVNFAKGCHYQLLFVS
jgi:hypothetical protein